LGVDRISLSIPTHTFASITHSGHKGLVQEQDRDLSPEGTAGLAMEQPVVQRKMELEPQSMERCHESFDDGCENQQGRGQAER
jgi:hypothetical protein